MNSNATRYLQKLRHSWYVRVKVPRHLQAAIGNTHFRKALHTRDLDTANQLKWAHVQAIKATFAKLSKLPPAPSDRHTELARSIRDALLDARQRGDVEEADALVQDAADHADNIEFHTDDRRKAAAWLEEATADTPLLSELLDTWLAGENYKEQTKRQHRAALDDLRRFMRGDRFPKDVTDRVAVSFVEDALKKSDWSYNTQRRKLNSLVRFWKWLGLRSYVPRKANPWTGFELSKARTRKATPDKRGYTDRELITLFGDRPKYNGLADLMVLGLFTGARIEELAALQMRDVEFRAEAFLVKLRTGKGKTRSRTIAVSHELASQVLSRRWSADAQPEARLFPEFTPGGYDEKLSWHASKAFGRFRDARGLSREVDFHSFRRTLVTALENLWVDQVAIARYVGHSLGTLAFQVYSGGSTEHTSREVARRIAYAPEVERAVGIFLSLATTQPAAGAVSMPRKRALRSGASPRATS